MNYARTLATSVVRGSVGKNSEDNDTKVESREERAKRIFNEVKELVMEAKNMNTFNF